LTAADAAAYRRAQGKRRAELMPNDLFPPGEVHVGQDLGGRHTTVTREQVSLYGEGTEDRHAWYRDGGPFAPPLAPALLFHSEVYRDLSWYLPNLIGNLHAKQEWELFHPVHVGDTVCTRSTVVERYRKRGRDYVVNEVLITAADGRWLQRSRTHQSFLADPAAGEIVIDKDRERRPERRFEVGEGGGEPLPVLAKQVTLEMCRAFSGPSRNYHTDREMAQALGFPDVVVQGMMSICFLSEMMTLAFGRGWLGGGKLNVNLVNVLWAGEAVSTHGKVRDAVSEGSRRRVTADVWCEKADGTKTVVGTASALR
jgi:acyl dehydratase